jgi:hypothetical protein
MNVFHGVKMTIQEKVITKKVLKNIYIIPMWQFNILAVSLINFNLAYTQLALIYIKCLV